MQAVQAVACFDRCLENQPLRPIFGEFDIQPAVGRQTCLQVVLGQGVLPVTSE